MGKIPTVERRVSPSGGDPFRTQRPDTSIGQAMERFGGAITGLGETIGDIDQKVKQIERTRKKSGAQLELQQAINSIKVAHAEDQDLDNTWKYSDELNTATNDIINRVDDPIVREELQGIAGGMRNSAKYSMDSLDVRRNVARAEDNIEVQRAASVELAANTNDPQAIMMARANYAQSLNDYAQLSGQSQEWVEQELRKRDTEVERSRLYSVANEDPDLALALIDSGAIELIDSEEKIKLRKSFVALKNTQEKDLKYAEKQAVLATQQNITSVYLDSVDDGTLNRSKMLEDIRIKAANGKVSTTFASQFEKLLSTTSEQLNKFDPNVYIEANMKWAELNQNDLDEVNQFQEYIVGKTGNGLTASLSQKFSKEIAAAKIDASSKAIYGSIFDSLVKAVKGIDFDKSPMSYFLPKVFSDRVIDAGAINDPGKMEKIANEVTDEYRTSKNGERIAAGDADFNTVGGVNVSDLRMEANKQNKAVVVKIVNGKVVSTGLTNRKKQ